jgi:hypothetical protein
MKDRSQGVRIYSPRMRMWINNTTDCIVWGGVLMASIGAVLFFSEVLISLTRLH